MLYLIFIANIYGEILKENLSSWKLATTQDIFTYYKNNHNILLQDFATNNNYQIPPAYLGYIHPWIKNFQLTWEKNQIKKITIELDRKKSENAIRFQFRLDNSAKIEDCFENKKCVTIDF